jgi:putative RecB family exonuclease
MWFYALVYYRDKGELPKQVKLMYLGGKTGEVLAKAPKMEDLEATEQKLARVWGEISKCMRNENWPAQKNKLCDWCGYQKMCPEFGAEKNVE